MKSGDLAYLLAVLENDEGTYKRKLQVQKEIQGHYDAARKSKAKAIIIRVTTQHGEAAAAARKA